MATTRQSTFGEVSVNKYDGDRECDACVEYNENGEPKKCTNSASYSVLRHHTGIAEFFCNVHAMDSWEDIE